MVRPPVIEGVPPEPEPDIPGFRSRQTNFLEVRGLAGADAPSRVELARQRQEQIAQMRRRLDPPQEEPGA